MITRNTDYSIQHLRGLSTDTKPTDVPNGSEFREMDTGKDFMFDESTGEWLVQPKKGGGVGDLEGLSVIKKIELSEPVRAVQIDIPSDYDWVYVLIKGEFTGEDWLYWGLNDTSSNNYTAKTTDISDGFIVTNSPLTEKGVIFGFRYNGPLTQEVSAPMEYIHFRGYSQDLKAGTKFYVYGGKYADM